MTMMMLARMSQMSGKNQKKKRSGIPTSMNLISLHQRIKKVPELLPEVKKARKRMMILKWMMNSKKWGFMMTSMMMMTRMITKKILFPVLYFERNQY